LYNDKQEKFIISYSARDKQIVVDRSSAGPSGFSKEFSGSARAPYQAEDQISFLLFVDAASVELFLDNGKLVMTNLVFPSEEFNKLRLFATGDGVLLEKAEFCNLHRIW